jgi:dephospho-CoA kinase
MAGARGARALNLAPPSRAGRRPLLIGLVGPIGCGKSTVAGWLAEAGARVIDADAVAREVTAPGEPGHDLVLEHFGPAFRRPDGTLDRAALGRRVFADPAALAELEALVHPLVRPRILAALAAARAADVPAIVLEAIKLVEAGYAALCDEVWLIACPAEEQQARLVGRGMATADATQRAVAQAGLTERLARIATRVVDTSSDPDVVRRRVDRALQDALARHGSTSAEAPGRT